MFILILGVVGLLERLQYQLRESEASRWWASNGRDVVNLFALATMTFGLFAMGFAGPLAFGLAATFVIVLAFLQGALEKRKNAVLYSVIAALVLGAPVLFAPGRVAIAFHGAVDCLFP